MPVAEGFRHAGSIPAASTTSDPAGERGAAKSCGDRASEPPARLGGLLGVSSSEDRELAPVLERWPDVRADASLRFTPRTPRGQPQGSHPQRPAPRIGANLSVGHGQVPPGQSPIVYSRPSDNVAVIRAANPLSRPHAWTSIT